MSNTEFNKEKLLGEIKEIISDSTKGVVTEKELNDKVAEINSKLEGLNNREDNHAEVKELKEAVDKLTETMTANSAQLKALKEEGFDRKDRSPKSFREAMKSAIMEKKDSFVNEVNDDYGKRLSMVKFFEEGGRKSPKFTISDGVSLLTREKAAVDMLQSNISGNYVDYHRLTDLDPNRVGIPLTIYPHVVSSLSSKRISKPYMALLVVGTYTDGSGTKTEGSASSKSSFLLTTTSFKAFYIATHFVLSDETLDDLDEVMDEISVTAPDKILDKIDSQVLGTTGDDSTAIAGLFTANKKTDFAATWDGTIDDATVVELIARMKLQCEGNKYKPDQVWMNPTDIANLASLKNDIADSIQNRQVVFGQNGMPVAVAGLRIMPNTNVTANTCAVLDSKQVWLGIRKDLEMEVGYNSSDLTEGQKTAVLKTRVAFGVRDSSAVIYSSAIATDVAAITSTP